MRGRARGWLVAGLLLVPLMAAGPANAEEPWNPQLVAAYSFDQGSGGSVPDESGHGLTGQIQGAAWEPNGIFGGAMRFNGVDSLVRIASDPLLDLSQGFTLEAWVKPDQADGWRNVLLRERGADGLSYGIYSSDESGKAAGYVNTGDSDRAVTGTSVPANTWTHLALFYEPDITETAGLLVNGEEVARLDLTGVPAIGGDLVIGGNAVWGEHFAGLIDEVRVWDRPIPGWVNQDMKRAVGDVAKPDMYIHHPAPGSTVTGTVLVQPVTFDQGATVSTLLDGEVVDGPHQPGTEVNWSWDTGTTSTGRHTLAMRIVTQEGLVYTSTPMEVVVDR